MLGRLGTDNRIYYGHNTYTHVNEWQRDHAHQPSFRGPWSQGVPWDHKACVVLIRQRLWSKICFMDHETLFNCYDHQTYFWPCTTFCGQTVVVCARVSAQDILVSATFAIADGMLTTRDCEMMKTYSMLFEPFTHCCPSSLSKYFYRLDSLAI